jgi:energy-coupling factor transport system permease protein
MEFLHPLREAVHPAIRIISLIVFAILVSHSTLWHLLLVLLLFIYIYFWKLSLSARQRALSMLFRMRWFFVSLLFVYGWLSPDPLTGEVSVWDWPNQSGLYAACRQILALSLIMLAVNVLFVSSRRQELVQAIYWLVRPLAFLGLSREQLAVRLVLVLDQAVTVREGLNQELSEQAIEKSGVQYRWRFSSISEKAAALIRRTLSRAETSADQHLIFYPLTPPPWYQWLMPVGIAVLFSF